MPSRPAGDVDYDVAGVGYATVRQADPRIEARVHAALGDARTVLNIGAGAGSYEPMDRHVIAIEPAAAMRAQRPAHRVPAIIGTAEALPLDDQSVDGSMAINTIHQWPDLTRGLSELRRVTRGPIVITAADRDALGQDWFRMYGPERVEAERRRLPPMDVLTAGLGGQVEIETVLIPHDCTDGFMEAFYGRPERLLDPAVRRAQSSWRFVAPDAEARFASTLSEDLASGAWDQRWGHLRTQPTFDGGLRLVIRRAP